VRPDPPQKLRGGARARGTKESQTENRWGITHARTPRCSTSSDRRGLRQRAEGRKNADGKGRKTFELTMLTAMLEARVKWHATWGRAVDVDDPGDGGWPARIRTAGYSDFSCKKRQIEVE